MEWCSHWKLWSLWVWISHSAQQKIKTDYSREAVLQQHQPSTAWRPAVSGVIGNVGHGSGRRRKGLLRSDVHPLCAPSRVQFRADVLQRRREEREVQELARQKKEEEKQNHLEALQSQVDCYLLLTFSTTPIFSVSCNDPQGETCTHLSWGIAATLWQ